MKNDLDNDLLELATSILVRHGWSPISARYYLRAYLTHGAAETANRFTLLIGEALGDARVQLYNRAILDTVWESLKTAKRAA